MPGCARPAKPLRRAPQTAFSRSPTEPTARTPPWPPPPRARRGCTVRRDRRGFTHPLVTGIRHSSEGIPTYPPRYSGGNGIVRQHTRVAWHGEPRKPVWEGRGERPETVTGSRNAAISE